MGNYQRKKRRAEEHNRQYAERKAAKKPANSDAVNVGTIGHVSHGRGGRRAMLAALLASVPGTVILDD